MKIDATNLILGRIATVVAKAAILGEDITIVNCENAYITGNKKLLLSEARRKREMGTHKGPIIPRMPDRYVKRAIRGMLPYKKDKGDKALKRIKCYIGVPDEFKNAKFETIEDANIKNKPTFNYVTIKEICKQMGAKI